MNFTSSEHQDAKNMSCCERDEDAAACSTKMLPKCCKM